MQRNHHQPHPSTQQGRAIDIDIGIDIDPARLYSSDSRLSLAVGLLDSTRPSLSLSPSPHCARSCAMPPRLTFEYNPLSYTYPDDELDKELFLQASGMIAIHLRTVLLYWVNMVFPDGEEVWQVVRLDRGEDDVHRYIYPDLIVVDRSEPEQDDEDEETFSLGVFTRDQREALLECAEEIEYNERSGDEGQCLRWMCRLLERMMEEELVEPSVVVAIRDAVLLPSGRR